VSNKSDLEQLALKKVEETMAHFIAETAYSDAITMYQQLSAGKRVRAKLVLKIAGIQDDAIKLAAVIELIHAASLLHDDVIDEADTRRGSPSINALYGDFSSIMLGDILYSKGFYELITLGSDIAQSVSGAVTELSIGEMMDVRLGEQVNEEQSLYFSMIYKKTASLIESCCYSAALLAGYDPKAYGLYGKNLGLAFQIVDDILDITMDAATLGKPALNDYKEGKTTLPYIFLLESMQQDEREQLLSYFKRALSEQETAWLKSMFAKYHAVEKSIAVAKKLGAEALQSIEQYNDRSLEKIMNDVIQRDY
jgi:octaprenyl-diphosphate synthase